MLEQLLQQLDMQQHDLNVKDRYYEGVQPLAFMSQKSKEAMDSRFDRVASNIARLAVTSLAERLRITGFTRAGEPALDTWDTWKLANMDQVSSTVHREALALGRCYVLVWANNQGAAQLTAESAHQVTHTTDPGNGSVVAAVKRWTTPKGATAVLYKPDEVVTYSANSEHTTGWNVTGRVENPLGHVPMVPIVNADRLLNPFGHSEITDLQPLVDLLAKTMADMAVTSEYAARPRRWATGVELITDDEDNAINPFPETDRMMISESTETRFGELPGAALGPYESIIRAVLGQIMAVSALPAHYIGALTEAPASADSLRASEASLSARAAARQATFGRAWEQVADLMHAVTNPFDDNKHTIVWADPTTRSIAQEADAAVKLHAQGILPLTETLRRMGYDEHNISDLAKQSRADAVQRVASQL